MSDEILQEVRLEVDQSAISLRKDVAETQNDKSKFWSAASLISHAYTSWAFHID